MPGGVGDDENRVQREGELLGNFMGSNVLLELVNRDLGKMSTSCSPGSNMHATFNCIIMHIIVSLQASLHPQHPKLAK